MRSGISTVEELIAHGGWLLDDVQARRAANPETFWMPTDEDLRRLVPGTQARLIFQLADQADPVVDRLPPYDPNWNPNLVVAHERMWVWVTAVDGDGADAELTGVLMNLPVATHSRLLPGAQVRFRRRDVIDVDLAPSVVMAEELEAMASAGFPLLSPEEVAAPEDPLRDPSIPPSQAEVCARFGVRPERPAPLPFSQCLLGRSVAEGTWPIYAVRSRPQADRQDCGWTIWATHSDMQDAADADGFEVVSVVEVQARHPLIGKYLALPPGFALVLGPDGFEDVYQDPDLLE